MKNWLGAHFRIVIVGVFILGALSIATVGNLLPSDVNDQSALSIPLFQNVTPTRVKFSATTTPTPQPNHPPYFVPAVPPTHHIYEGLAVNIPVVAQDQDGDSLTIVGSVAPYGLILSSTTITGTPVWNPQTDSQSWCFQAHDSRGLTSLGQYCVTFIFHHNSPPAVTNPGNQNTAVGGAVSLQIVATDQTVETVETIAALRYTASGLPAGLGISTTGLISGKPTTAGTSNVSVGVSDGIVTTTVSFQWTVS